MQAFRDPLVNAINMILKHNFFKIAQKSRFLHLKDCRKAYLSHLLNESKLFI